MRFRRFFSAFFCAVLLLTLCPLAGAAEEKELPTLDIKAKAALLVDQNTGKIVYGKNEHEEIAGRMRVLAYELHAATACRALLEDNGPTTATYDSSVPTRFR